MAQKKDDYIIFSETQDGSDDGHIKLEQLEILWEELPEDLGDTEKSSFIEVMSRLVKYYRNSSHNPLDKN